MFMIEVEERLQLCRFKNPSNGNSPKLETFKVRLQIASNREIQPGGTLTDLSSLEKVLHRVISELDGQSLAELEIFNRKEPSLENLAQFLFKKTEILLERSGVFQERSAFNFRKDKRSSIANKVRIDRSYKFCGEGT